MPNILIVGGGLVGLTVANLLVNIENINLNITLLEPNQPDLKWEKDSYDLRCYSINHGSKKIFNQLNIWNKINKASYNTMQVWDQTGYGEINFDAKEINQQDLGYMVEHRELIKSLWENLLDNSINCNNVKNKVKIIKNKYQDFDSIGKNKYDLIIAADGSNSKIRKDLNINTKENDYNQMALVATVKTQYTHNRCARQRFLVDGPLAFLPLQSPNHCSIVWTSNIDKIKYLQNIEISKFNQELTKNFSNCLGKVELLTNTSVFPLKSIYSINYFKHNVVLVGDAAHVIHPLAGQGVNLGLQDARVLVEVIAQALLNNQQVSDMQVLYKYQKLRKNENFIMLKGMEFLNNLFGTNNKPVWLLRNMGLNIVNNINFFKNKFMLKAMGL